MATLATSLGPSSEDEEGTHDEAVSESDLREADVGFRRQDAEHLLDGG